VKSSAGRPQPIFETGLRLFFVFWFGSVLFVCVWHCVHVAAAHVKNPTRLEAEDFDGVVCLITVFRFMQPCRAQLTPNDLGFLGNSSAYLCLWALFHNRKSAAKHAETHFVVLLRLLLRASTPAHWAARRRRLRRMAMIGS
jgi:hypothetical protein